MGISLWHFNAAAAKENQALYCFPVKSFQVFNVMSHAYFDHMSVAEYVARSGFLRIFNVSLMWDDGIIIFPGRCCDQEDGLCARVNNIMLSGSPSQHPDWHIPPRPGVRTVKGGWSAGAVSVISPVSVSNKAVPADNHHPPPGYYQRSKKAWCA